MDLKDDYLMTIAAIAAITETPGRLIMFNADTYQSFIDDLKGGIPVVRDLLINSGLISRRQDIGKAGLDDAMHRARRAKPSQIGLAPAYYAYRAQCSAVSRLSDELFMETVNVFEILGELLIMHGYWRDEGQLIDEMIIAFPDYPTLVRQYSRQIETRYNDIGHRLGYI